jgi:hypothetical protein
MPPVDNSGGVGGGEGVEQLQETIKTGLKENQGDLTEIFQSTVRR